MRRPCGCSGRHCTFVLVLVLVFTVAVWLSAVSIALAAEQVVFSDGFEGGDLTAWTVDHATGTAPENFGQAWKAVDWGVADVWAVEAGRPHTAYCARVHNEYPSWEYRLPWPTPPIPMYNEMIAGPFDLSDATSARLTFDAWCRLYTATYQFTEDEWWTNDEFTAMYSTDGVNWTDTEYGAGMSTSGWKTIGLDLAGAAGKKTVWIGFTYHASSVGDAWKGAYVDNVSLTKTTGGTTGGSTGQNEIAGTTRIGTAVAASKAAFPSGAPAVVIATAYNFPDALGGSSLAGSLESPLLLTAKDGLPAEVVAEIKRLGAKQAAVLGSQSAVSSNVVIQLQALLGSSAVTRYGGADRYETAVKIAAATVAVTRAKGGSYDGSVFIATGENFPDALAASPIAAKNSWPILLSRSGSLPDVTKDALSAIGAKRAMLLGSQAAVSSDVFTAVAAATGATPTRLAGPDRYRTAIAIADYGVTQGLGWNGLALATGTNYPDALAGGVMCGRLGSVMLLTPPNTLDANVATTLRAHKAEIESVRYLGSASAISSAVRSAAAGCLN